ncbi:eukaryotic translation initiation factor 5 [Blastocladiella emersonii ATCC 22665]|nr:eukaryotic translation initiation factor 5 [Blastocladiella emersonii ATCC 22665]
MSMLNIGGDKDDLFYRYKMPPIQSKVEGKGNGIKTVIPNMNDIGKALNRPPMYPCKYFGTELGAQTKHEPKNDRYIVNGAHDAARLQELLTGFIEKFVLCGACGNPETDLKFVDGMIERACLACGKITPIDMRHKLTNFILNNPPAGAVVSGGKKKGKRGKNAAAKSKDQTPRDSADEEDASGDELHKQIMAEAKHLGDSQMKDDDWSVDLGKDAQKQRQADLLKGVEQLAVDEKKKAGKKAAGKGKKAAAASDDEDDDFAEDDPLDALATFVANKPKATAAVILAEVKESGIPAHLATHVLAQVLIRPDTLSADIKARAPVFAKLNKGNARAQKYFLGGLERLVATNDAFKKVPVMLKNIYELDLVDEAAILAWGARATKKWTGKKALSQQVRDAAEAFLNWLKEAEEDDSEEEDSEEDDE